MSVHRPDLLRAAGNTVPLAAHLPRRPGPFARLAHAVSAARERERVRRELYALSPAELRDIGLNRGDVERVFDPAFAEEFAGRR